MRIPKAIAPAKIADIFGNLSDMKIVTVGSLRRQANLLDSAASEEVILVTRFGKRFVRILPARRARVKYLLNSASWTFLAFCTVRYSLFLCQLRRT